MATKWNGRNKEVIRFGTYLTKNEEKAIRAAKRKKRRDNRRQSRLLNGKIDTHLISLNKLKAKVLDLRKRFNTVEIAKRNYDEYLKHPAWFKFREYIRILRNNQCEKCKNNEKFQVHHLHYRNIGNEKDEDVQLLCRKCHESTHKIA